MEQQKQEKTILNVITYGPVIMVIVVSFLITQILLNDKETNFQIEMKKYKETFMETHKNRVKKEVNDVYNYITSEKNDAEEILKKSLKSRIYETHAIATAMYNQEVLMSHKIPSKKEFFESIKNTLNSMNYNKDRGYLFIINEEGKKLLPPWDKEFTAQNNINIKDSKGYKFVKKIVKTIENKTEAYDSYYWYKINDSSKDFKKTSFYKYFEPLNVAIGTGEYLDDFKIELKNKILQKIQNFKYGKNGYIFIYDINGNCLSHSDKKHIGTNRFNYKDKKGNYLIQDIINTAVEKKSSFIAYESTYKPDDSDIISTSKISYLKLFEEWGWIIGTGFYTDSLVNTVEKKKKELKKLNLQSIKKITYYSISITILFIFISFLVSRKMKIIFENYKTTIRQKEYENIKKNVIIYQQSKMTVIGELLNIIAHQWRQPLSQINATTLSMYLEQKNGLLNEKVLKQNINEIENTTQYLSQTIDDFSKFFIQESSDKIFFINESINDCINIVNPSLHHINLQLDLKNQNSIKGYKTLFQQIILSLISNSIYVFNDKDISKPSIGIKTYDQDKFTYIEISDNGGGIKPEFLPKIFDLYFSTKEKKYSTGLGLYIVKEIIEKHFNGHISAKNIHNGITFTIRIKNHDIK